MLIVPNRTPDSAGEPTGTRSWQLGLKTRRWNMMKGQLHPVAENRSQGRDDRDVLAVILLYVEVSMSLVEESFDQNGVEGVHQVAPLTEGLPDGQSDGTYLIRQISPSQNMSCWSCLLDSRFIGRILEAIAR